MAAKLQYYADLADRQARQVTGSRKSWTGFLETAGRLYKYPFDEQLMIYAQRPGAQACASLETWNKPMNRYVRRGSKGIALIDYSTDKPSLRYVFDYADTEDGRHNPRRPFIWQMEREHEQSVIDSLSANYGLPGPEENIGDVIFGLAHGLAARYYEDNARDIGYAAEGSFLEGYDEFNISVAFKEALTVSAAYSIMARCGIDASGHIDDEDFQPVFDFNTPDSVYALGKAVSEVTEEVLRDIELIIKKYERQKAAGLSADRQERSGHNERSYIQQGRGLPQSGHSGTGVPAAGQIRDNAEKLPEKPPPGSVQPVPPDREAVPPLPGDRRYGEREAGTDDDPVAGANSAARQGQRPDGLGGAHEQPQSPSGGNNLRRIDLQLEQNEDTGQTETPSDMGGVSLFPAENEQIAAIREAGLQAAAVASTAITQDDIDNALRGWNGDPGSISRVCEYMSTNGRSREAAAFLQAEYGKPEFIVDKDGAEPLVLPWAKAQRRIAQLIAENAYITAPLEAAVAPENNGQAEQAEYILSYRYANDRLIVFNDYHYNTDEISPIVARVEPDGSVVIIDENLPDAQRFEIRRVAETELDRYRAEAEANLQQMLDTALAHAAAVEQPEQPAGPQMTLFGYLNENGQTFFSVPYSVGDTVFLENDRVFIIEEITSREVKLLDPSLYIPITRLMNVPDFEREYYLNPKNNAEAQASEIHAMEPPLPEPQRPLQAEPPTSAQPPVNFRITDEHLGEGGAKTKYGFNTAAIKTLQTVESENRRATPEEQEVLSRYVGWGGLPQAFDPDSQGWAKEYAELKAMLSPEEYDSARASTLNAHYTSPTVITAMHETLERMGVNGGNILEPAMGVGNFFGLLPDSMRGAKLYGVELDGITGRIAKQLYQNADIKIAGFEKTDMPDSFFDVAIGNVPFGSYKLADKRYDKHNFLIHDYFFAKALDQVRPGGIIAFITSKGTLDKANPEVRKYIAQRAELLGAVRLPNNAFKANAGTEVTSDIIFLQKRDRLIDVQPDWVHLGQTANGIPVNSYFVENPHMVLGEMAYDEMMYGNKSETTCNPIEGADLAKQLQAALSYIQGEITEIELDDIEGIQDVSIPADPSVRNFSYAIVDGAVYYRENSRMNPVDMPAATLERVKGMAGLRDCVRELIDYQLHDYPDSDIRGKQRELNRLYDGFTRKHGLISDKANSKAFSADSAYYLLCSLEVIGEDGALERKSDMFTKRTIRQKSAVTSVDTSSEALAVSIAKKARVDIGFMQGLTGFTEDKIVSDLTGVVFRNPQTLGYEPADEYLSGNVREKLRIAKSAAESDPTYAVNVKALEQAQPKDLDASEISVRLGSTWVDKHYVQQFMFELLQPPRYLRYEVAVNYAEHTGEWNVAGKNRISYNDVLATVTYGTSRANAYKIIEETLNLKDMRIYDTVQDADGKDKRVLNKKETTLAAQKQDAIKQAFKDWVFRDPERRQTLVQQYNERFNSTRAREYDGSHIEFAGASPEISLKPHQRDAIARILYGGNTLLAHEVGAGKTFEMVGAAMELKRLGLCQKSLMAVPNHLTEQMASEFLRLYPSANILVAARKDFEAKNRKKFCAKIATGDYDAVIIGHTQLEKIPLSKERQERLLSEQIEEITEGIAELKGSHGERFTIKQLEKTKKNLESRLDKLTDDSRKDDVVTFEQLGVDRLFVDESHNFKNRAKRCATSCA